MTDTPPLAVEIAHLNKWYGQFHVLRDIDLSVAEGERIVICGPSGSGKSTLIRCVNGLEAFQQGSLAVDGMALNRNSLGRSAARRRHGVSAFQPVLTSHSSRKLHTCADPGSQDEAP